MGSGMEHLELHEVVKQAVAVVDIRHEPASHWIICDDNGPSGAIDRNANL